MFSWIKSLFTDVPAGTVMVVASLALVATVMYSLGEIAAAQPERDTLLPADSPHATRLPDDFSAHSATAALSGDQGAPKATISVMVPVGALR